MPNNYNNNERAAEPAGFFVRLAAYALDSLIVFFGLLIVRLIMSFVMSALGDSALSGDILFQYSLKDIVLYIVQVLYFILMTYFTGTTPGKRAMNLSVISADEESSDQKLTLIQVIYRETIGRFLSSVILCVGYLMIGADREKRGLHDMLADTRVVYARRIKTIPVYQMPQGQPPMTPPGQPPMTPPGTSGSAGAPGGSGHRVFYSDPFDGPAEESSPKTDNGDNKSEEK